MAVKLPPLGAAERAAATALQMTATQGGERDVHLHLGPPAPTSALLDGSLQETWAQPYAFEQFPVQAPASNMEWVFQLQEPLSEAKELYLVSDDKVFALRFLPQAGTSYAMPAPPNSGCFALVQGARPLPVVEVMGRIQVDPVPSLAALLARLDDPDAGFAPQALVLRGEAAEAALNRAFPRLSPLGKQRALAVALRSPWGATVLATALDVGEGEVSQVAQRELVARGTSAQSAIVGRLRTARPESIRRLVLTLFEVDQETATSVILEGLGQANREQRTQYRQAFVRLFAQPTTRGVLETRLFEKGGFMALSPTARLEVLRSVSSDYDLSQVAEAVLELTRTADFERAYLLVDVLTPRLDVLSFAAAVLKNWLEGKALAQLTATQSAALSTHIFERISDSPQLKSSAALAAPAQPLLSNENVRVRASAAQFLALHPQKSAQSTLMKLLRKDAWPEVRQAAALALGATLQSPTDQALRDGDQQAFDLLLGRLRKDEEPRVRRALLVALPDAPPWSSSFPDGSRQFQGGPAFQDHGVVDLPSTRSS